MKDASLSVLLTRPVLGASQVLRQKLMYIVSICH